ncbi:MAG: arylsulfatase, partial [Verrucomicrobiales bacterium]
RVPMIARWPGKIEAGTTTAQSFCLTDVMATCAAIVGAELPADAAEDSFNFLPVLTGSRPEDEPVRTHTLHQTIRLALAIRRGPWKYLDHTGSGGNRYDQPMLKGFRLREKAPDAPAQLYNLDDDPGETTNLYFQHPEIVAELKSKLEESRVSGRSAP